LFYKIDFSVGEERKGKVKVKAKAKLNTSKISLYSCGVAQMAKQLPNKHEILSSNPST
jgi:hypothetical protein